jgi:hypothetical protein
MGLASNSPSLHLTVHYFKTFGCVLKKSLYDRQTRLGHYAVVQYKHKSASGIYLVSLQPAHFVCAEFF